MTVEDLLNWPHDDGYRYEVVVEVLVCMAGSKPRALFIADRLYHAPTTLTGGNTLDGKDVVPGFSYPVSRIFVYAAHLAPPG